MTMKRKLISYAHGNRNYGYYRLHFGYQIMYTNSVPYLRKIGYLFLWELLFVCILRAVFTKYVFVIPQFHNNEQYHMFANN